MFQRRYSYNRFNRGSQQQLPFRSSFLFGNQKVDPKIQQKLNPMSYYYEVQGDAPAILFFNKIEMYPVIEQGKKEREEPIQLMVLALVLPWLFPHEILYFVARCCRRFYVLTWSKPLLFDCIHNLFGDEQLYESFVEQLFEEMKKQNEASQNDEGLQRQNSNNLLNLHTRTDEAFFMRKVMMFICFYWHCNGCHAYFLDEAKLDQLTVCRILKKALCVQCKNSNKFVMIDKKTACRKFELLYDDFCKLGLRGMKIDLEWKKKKGQNHFRRKQKEPGEEHKEGEQRGIFKYVYYAFQIRQKLDELDEEDSSNMSASSFFRNKDFYMVRRAKVLLYQIQRSFLSGLDHNIKVEFDDIKSMMRHGKDKFTIIQYFRDLSKNPQKAVALQPKEPTFRHKYH